MRNLFFVLLLFIFANSCSNNSKNIKEPQKITLDSIENKEDDFMWELIMENN